MVVNEGAIPSREGPWFGFGKAQKLLKVKIYWMQCVIWMRQEKVESEDMEDFFFFIGITLSKALQPLARKGLQSVEQKH